MQTLNLELLQKNGNSLFFNCLKGVRQGENLSPLLFSLFLNDLEEFLCEKRAKGVNSVAQCEGFYQFLQIFIILYADDTVIVSENETDLQNSLNIFEKYCLKWKLTVNVSKTKILLVGTRKKNYNIKFLFNGQELEIVNEYKYLGIYVSRSGSNLTAKKHIAEQANKAMFSLLKKIRILNLPIDLQVDIFCKTIRPILLYGCEIWGFGNLDILERVQLKFFKLILNLKKSTPSNMIYGELGVLPLEVDIKSRIVAFWSRLHNVESRKLSSNLYFNMFINQNQIKCKWIENVRHLIVSNGYGYLWNVFSDVNAKWLTLSFKQKIKDQFMQNWKGNISQTSSAKCYNLVKENFVQSKYINILPKKNCKTMMAFLCRNHRLPIEVGRWHSIPIPERKCQLCHIHIGDEFHYVLECKNFIDDRKKFVKAYYYRHPNILKYNQLFNSENKIELIKLCQFLEIIMKNVKVSYN